MKNDTGIREKVKGRKPRLSVYVDNYLSQHAKRIHQKDIDEVIAKLQKLQGLKPQEPVQEPTPAAPAETLAVTTVVATDTATPAVTEPVSVIPAEAAPVVA